MHLRWWTSPTCTYTWELHSSSSCAFEHIMPRQNHDLKFNHSFKELLSYFFEWYDAYVHCVYTCTYVCMHYYIVWVDTCFATSATASIFTSSSIPTSAISCIRSHDHTSHITTTTHGPTACGLTVSIWRERERERERERQLVQAVHTSPWLQISD